MNAEGRDRWLDPSPPIPVDDAARADLTPEHTISVRYRRARFADPETYAALCTCGWRGQERTGSNAARTARRDGDEHIGE